MFGVRQGLIRYGVRAAGNVAPKAAPTTTSMVLRRQATSTTQKVNFFEKNLRLKRPLSPHLTIYAPQMTSMLSVGHRITGSAYYFVVGLPAIGLLVTGSKVSDALELVRSFSIDPVLIQSAKFLLTWPFVYHAMNGVRHLMWDRVVGVSIPFIYKSGSALLAAATVVSAALVSK